MNNMMFNHRWRVGTLSIFRATHCSSNPFHVMPNARHLWQFVPDCRPRGSRRLLSDVSVTRAVIVHASGTRERRVQLGTFNMSVGSVPIFS